jgi:PAS domain S-box-containing protein
LTIEQLDQNLFLHLLEGVKDYSIFALDREGCVVSWNDGAKRLSGYSEDEIIGKHFSLFYSKEDQEKQHFDVALKTALEKGSYEEEGWRIGKGGKQFLAHVVLSSLYDEAGNHTGFVKLTRDLTERKEASEDKLLSAQALKRTEETFTLLVGAVREYAIFFLNSQGIIKTWNAGAQRIKGYSAHEIIGQHFSIFYTDEDRRKAHPEFELKEAVKTGSYEEEGWRVRKDGTKFWASVTITPIQDDGGAIVGFVKVTRDLTEKKLHQTELERARDEAIQANELKSKFVANISHEIRTPLSGIIGLSELIIADEEVRTDLHDASTRIFDSAKYLLQLLNDLLDFAKLEAGRVEVERIGFDARALVDQVHGLTREIASEKSLRYQVNIAENVPELLVGDPTKIRQILLNLISNAFKFTDSGDVTIDVKLDGNSIVYSVRDTGIGIPEKQIEKLFTPFTQANESTSRLFGGTGLGLSIAHQYIQLMGGKIDLNSEFGKGTTVWFSLPLSNPE